MNAEETSPAGVPSPTDPVAHVRLRPVQEQDLAKIYEFQLDPEANRMAFTHPRLAAEFDAHWQQIRTDPRVAARAIVADDRLAGCISCFESEGQDSIGYWIGRGFWGKGVATRALGLLLKEVPIRPLQARVAVTNVASIRVLEKCGFAIVRQEWSPETDRYVACEEAVLKLPSCTSP